MSSSSSQPSLEDRAVGLFLCGAIGDAKGIAFDGQKFGTYEVPFEPPYQTCPPSNTFMPRGFLAGSFTDDTQLCLAIARSFIRSRSFDMNAIADEHVRELQRSTAGWGRTKGCVERIACGSHTWRDSGDETGMGNGVLMKIAPVAYWLAHRPPRSVNERVELVTQLACMTHCHPICITSAIVHCVVLERLYKSDADLLSTQEKRYQFLDLLIKEAERIEALSATALEPTYRLSVRLKPLAQLAPQCASAEGIVALAHGGGYNAVDSLMMVYCVLMTRPLGFSSLLFLCSLGGNTDSNCSMYGQILGGVLGQREAPPLYVSALLGHQEVIEVAKRFAEVIRLKTSTMRPKM